MYVLFSMFLYSYDVTSTNSRQWNMYMTKICRISLPSFK